MEQKIFEYCDIDTRLLLKVPPRRLRVNRHFIPKAEIVYDTRNQILLDFTEMCSSTPRWFVYKKIPFSGYRSPVHIFNMGWEDHSIVMYGDSYTMGPKTIHRHFVTSRRVKFIHPEA